MIIRKAKIEDTEVIAGCMMLAMDQIVYKLIGEESRSKAICFLESLIRQKETQYSYENCWVMEAQGKIVSVVNIYDGAQLKELSTAVVKQLKADFKREFNLEAETRTGEFYIDTLSVCPNWQGKGLGTKMLRFLIGEYVTKSNKTLGLLVDKENSDAKRLYLKLGFNVVGEKTLAGKSMEHLQIGKACVNC